MCDDWTEHSLLLHRIGAYAGGFVRLLKEVVVHTQTIRLSIQKFRFVL